MNTQLPRLVLALTIVALLGYWGWRLFSGMEQPLREALPDLGALASYLFGIVGLLVGLWLIAFLNHRLAFMRWMLRPETAPFYWIWVCVMAWLVFELLQLRTEAVPEFVDENLLVTGVLLVFVIGYGYVADYLRTRRDQLRLMQQTTEAELTALRAQVNPHFLFNALNTIYNEAQRAHNDPVADLIGQLSGLMRYTLQEATRPTTSVESELAFIEKYVALQRVRLPESAKLRVTLRTDSGGQPGEPNPLQMAPLLLIPFVENAFQYGISLEHTSYIDINIEVEGRQLQMQITNSRPPGLGQKHGAGTGIPNARQRLERAYPAWHSLQISHTDKSFTVNLRIDL